MTRDLLRFAVAAGVVVNLLSTACSPSSAKKPSDDPTDDQDDGPKVDDDLPPDSPLLPAPAPATPALWRLTERQYNNALRDLLGDDAKLPPAKPELDSGGLAVLAAGTVTTSDAEVERFESLAGALAADIFADPTRRTKLAGCDAADDKCLRDFISGFGQKAFRRPLTDDEQARYVQLAEGAVALTKDAWSGLEAVTAALLQSPKFLYRIEVGTPDSEDETRNVLSSFERAERLSFFLWDSIPDDDLLAAAADDELLDGKKMREQFDRLWEDPRTRATWRSFIEENYRISELQRSAAKVSPGLLTSMRNEVLDLAEGLAFDDDGDFLRFFTHDQATIDSPLREHYGLSAGDESAPAKFPDEQERMGFLGSAAFLTMTSTALHTSPTARGKFIRERVLCQEVPQPPAGVDTSLPPVSTEVRTTRERLEAHRQDPTCASCHEFMDPVGLGFERFDQVGRYRTSEEGEAIRTDGSIDDEKFSGPASLAGLLVARPEAAACVALGLLRQATGYQGERMSDDDDDALVQAIGGQLARNEHKIRGFLADLAASPSFVTRQRESVQ